MSYLDQYRTIDAIQRRTLQALYKMAFDIRQGTANEQALYQAIFSDRTRFSLLEALLLAYFFSVPPNDLRVLGSDVTDAQLQVCVDGIKAELITRQNDTGRPIIGLGGFASI